MKKSILPYNEFLTEKGKNPCWKGYRQIGTKKKDGRVVPNCVKVDENEVENSGLTPEQKEWLDECTRGTWSINPETGLVDIIGSFRCSDQGLVNFKGVSFGNVSEYFNCAFNNLTSLEGAPRNVDSFHCNSNNLTSLKGGPLKVDGDFNCAHNNLTSLEDSPVYVSDNFYCEGNKISSLKGAPQKCRNFRFQNNMVVNLEGFPFKCLDFNGNGNPLSDKMMAKLGKTLINYESSDRESFGRAVASHWGSIDMTEEDELLLARYNPGFSQEEIRGYEALRKFREKII
jgi:hypothetical protein